MNDQSLRFRDILLRIAQDAGMQAKTAGSADGLPADPAYLQRLKDAANDGREVVYTAIDPATGVSHDWNCLRPLTEFTFPATAGARNVDGNTAKLWLDASYQILDRSAWSWRSTDGGFSGNLTIVHADHLARRHGAEPDASAHPRLAALMARGYDGDQGGIRGGMVLWIWPKPDTEYVLSGLCRRLPHPLVELDDVEPMGAAHSQTIIAAGIAAMRSTDPDLSRRDWYIKQRDIAILRSMRHDQLLTPPVLGEVVDGNLINNGPGCPPFSFTRYNDIVL